jgi:YegS/Rv2252/BmrU family lipid kinase
VEVLVIYNPAAANGRARSAMASVRESFSSRGVQIELRLTERPGHAVEIVRDADLGSYDGVVAGGGDGTLFEVVNGYFLNPAAGRPPLGVLPVGTGNAFSKDISLDTGAVEQAVGLIAAGNHRPVDVGRFTTGGETYHYLNILGLGFVSDVGETASRLKIVGNLSYTIAVLLRMISLSSYRMTIEVDGRELKRENIFCEISNTRYTSNFLMAPSASIEDGLLDVTLLGKASRTYLLRCFPKIFTGEHVELDEVETFKAKKIRIHTDDPKVLTPDGEIFGSTPVEVECLHRALEVFSPPSGA